MGVKELWSILSPVCDKKSLWELEGKTLAIDLSCWVCDSSHFAGSQPNTYLRNLFFRTTYLLQLGAKPLFVLEGKAPQLKYKTIRRRLNNDKGEGQQPNGKEGKVVRSRLSALQKQCLELLSCLGVRCITAPGEAEAFCAHLNMKGLACGVVTQDSDVFLYGGTEVYRNFQLSPGYCCDVYRTATIEERLGLTRERMVALSLLLGCDYSEGVGKVGRESALKFVRSVPHGQIFDRFARWKNKYLFTFDDEKEKYLDSTTQLELAIRAKALADEGFPHPDVVEEYLREPDDIVVDYTWEQPNMARFVSFAVRKLGWEEDYCVKKMLPVVTRWHLENEGAPVGIDMTSIVKTRLVRSVPCYEVAWDAYNETTVELKRLVDRVYPEIVAAFEESKAKPKKAPKERKRKERKEAKEDVQRMEEVAAPSLDKFVVKFPANDKPSVETIVIEHDDVNDSLADVTGDPDGSLNLSSVVNTIISRPNSNPAVLSYYKMKCAD